MTRKEEMYALIADQQVSGLSQVAFCRDRQLSLATFQYWLAKKRKETEAVSAFPMRFVPLRVEEKNPESLEIIFPNGVKVSGIGRDVDLLMRLVQSWR